MHVELYRS
jgi:hypothetical protein